MNRKNKLPRVILDLRIPRFNIISPSSNKLSVVSIAENCLAVKQALLVSLSHVSAVQFKPHDCIDTLLSSRHSEMRTGCFQFAAAETKQAWRGRPRCSTHSLECYVFFSARDQKHVPADYWVTTGSSVCSRKLVTVTKNQDNSSFDH